MTKKPIVNISCNTLTKNNLRKLRKKIVKWVSSGMTGPDIMYQLSIDKLCKDYTVVGKEIKRNEYEIQLIEKQYKIQ